MGKASEKREARNVAIVRQHAVAMVVSTAVFAAYRLYHHAATRSWFNWLTLLVASTVYAGCYWVLSGHVALGDVELFQAGLVEYSWDLVWYTLFVQILSNFTDWAWALYVIVSAARRAAVQGARSCRQRILPSLPLCAAMGGHLLLRMDAPHLPVDHQARRRRRWRCLRCRRSQEARQAREAAAPREGQVRMRSTGAGPMCRGCTGAGLLPAYLNQAQSACCAPWLPAHHLPAHHAACRGVKSD